MKIWIAGVTLALAAWAFGWDHDVAIIGAIVAIIGAVLVLIGDPPWRWPRPAPPPK